MKKGIAELGFEPAASENPRTGGSRARTHPPSGQRYNAKGSCWKKARAPFGVGIGKDAVGGVAAPNRVVFMARLAAQQLVRDSTPCMRRACASDRLDIVHTLRRLQKRVDHHGLLDAVPGFELGQKLVEIMNVPWSLNLGQHEHVELIAHGGHDLNEFGRTGLWTRVNALNSPWVLDDILEIMAAVGDKLDVLMLPKVEGPWDIHYFDQLLAQLEARHGIKKPVMIHALLETAEGVNNVEAIAGASPRMHGMSLGRRTWRQAGP